MTFSISFPYLHVPDQIQILHMLDNATVGVGAGQTDMLGYGEFQTTNCTQIIPTWENGALRASPQLRFRVWVGSCDETGTGMSYYQTLVTVTRRW